jgi:hypothetical protein
MTTRDDHVHDCTGPGMKCPCGFVLYIPPIIFSLDVYNKSDELFADAFNCESVDDVIDALRGAIRKLERLR